MNEDASGDISALQRQIQQLKVYICGLLFLLLAHFTMDIVTCKKVRVYRMKTGSVVFSDEASESIEISVVWVSMS